MAEFFSSKFVGSFSVNCPYFLSCGLVIIYNSVRIILSIDFKRTGKPNLHLLVKILAMSYVVTFEVQTSVCIKIFLNDFQKLQLVVEYLVFLV